jgi:chromosome segregation ATPase
MSQPARLEERVSDLETEMAQVRFLATKAESEVSDMQAVLRGHTGVLNAIRKDQVKQGEELAGVKAEVKSVKAEMHEGFTRVDERFTRVDEKFARVDEKFAKVDEKFAEVDERFDKVDEKFAKVDERFDKLETKVDKGFAKVDKGFAQVEDKFALLHEGQERITELLTQHLGEPDDETSAGGADE